MLLLVNVVLEAVYFVGINLLFCCVSPTAAAAGRSFLRTNKGNGDFRVLWTAISRSCRMNSALFLVVYCCVVCVLK